MIKLIDVDSLFDKYISDYVYSNINKVKPDEIENKIPNLYQEFGDVALPELDGLTPNTYYKQFDINELLKCLKSHIEKQISVSDFLCEAITCNAKNCLAIIGEINKENGEEYTMYLMNMLAEMNAQPPLKRYIEFVTFDYSINIRELATELLYDYADQTKEDILSAYATAGQEVRECLTDILSHASKDDRIFEILIKEFLAHPNEIPLYAGYLGKYGDDRALPYLMQTIEQDKLTYADFEELRFAIEALGGEYDKIRDFSKDKSYKKIKDQLKS